jgi:hypothetical protein
MRVDIGRWFFLASVIVGLCWAPPTTAALVARLLDVQRIWNDAPHNAFTDLVRFDDAFYVAFREGPLHVVPAVGQPGGDLRVLRSEDGQNWTTAALFEGGIDRDFRDAKMTIAPNGNLILAGAYAPHDSPSERQSIAWSTGDGVNWSDMANIGDANYWLWGVQSHGHHVYSIAYGPTTSGPPAWHTRLYRGNDGTSFDTWVPTLTADSGSSEAALLFRSDDTAVALVRRDAGSFNAVLGTATGDFSEWTFQDTGVRVGGPEMIELPTGQIVAGGRLYNGGQRTSLMWVDPENASLTEFLTLPSAGDSSYPGMVWHNDRLWVSYYSSHEGRASIYMAQIEFVEDNPANLPPIRHSGSLNPAEQFWSPMLGGTPIAANAAVDDAGVSAWNIHDNSTAPGSRAAWFRALTGGQLEAARNDGWRMKGRLRVLNNNDTPDGAIEMSVFLDSDRGYVLWLGSDAAGNTLVSEVIRTSGAVTVGRSATVAGLSYHDFEMVFDPQTQTVDLWANGDRVIADLQPLDLQGNVLNRVAWGSNSSAGVGNANYEFIHFTIGDVLAGDYNGDGIVDAADYTVWRDSVGSRTDPSADGNNDGIVDAADYLVWRAAFGATSQIEPASSAVVPEPGGLWLAAIGLAVVSEVVRRAANAI